jgi:phage-related protein
VATWLVRTFTTSAGGKPVEEWVRSLTPEGRAAVGMAVRLLGQHGTGLEMPRARFLDDGIWELRTQTSDGIQRILYFHWFGRTFGLLHGFTKKTRKIPSSELELARERKRTWIARSRPRTGGKTGNG